MGSWAVSLNRRDTTITPLGGGIHFTLANHLTITCMQGEIVLTVNGCQLLVIGIIWELTFTDWIPFWQFAFVV